ncbi:MAG: T9SS type A sorting domain-containing protein [Bacteroidetes bacterium]|nr:T9SS type A sorting domain-containing protein [Bacteroidota bacterium]
MNIRIILLFTCFMATHAFAQMHQSKYTYLPSATYHTPIFSAPNARLVTVTDTGYYWNNPVVQIDTTGSYLLDQVMPADSGYWFGTNIYNFMGYAELYDVNKADTDTTIMQILGVVSAWHGRVKTGSSNTITFKVWDQDSKAYFQGDTTYIKGYPGSVKYSLSWPVTQLQIGGPSAPDTTPVIAMFPSPINSMPDHFFVGYEVAYDFNSLDGDTITLGATPQGNAKKVGMHYVDSVSGNLIYIPRNAIEVTSGNWQDCYYNYGFQVNLGIVPIVRLKRSYEDLDIKGITKNDLIFLGNYPNPSSAATNIKFDLKTTANVSIQVMDMQGRKVTAVNAGVLMPGEHTVPLSTAGMPAGEYIYMLSTNKGDAIAATLSVVK